MCRLFKYSQKPRYLQKKVILELIWLSEGQNPFKLNTHTRARAHALAHWHAQKIQLFLTKHKMRLWAKFARHCSKAFFGGDILIPNPPAPLIWLWEIK